jgi:hypothetical protein
MRPVPTADRIAQHVSLLTDGHKTVCAEIMNLCADHAERTQELSAAAEAVKVLASVAGEPIPELESRVVELLERFGITKPKAE